MDINKVNELAFSLHDELLASSEYKKLKADEKIMVEDESLKPLFLDYKKAQEIYVNDKSQKTLNKLSKIKSEIYSNKLVINYLNSYKQYQLLIGKITDIVFDDLLSSSDIIKKIRAI